MKRNKVRLFQNFSFWKSYLRFGGKTGAWAGFSKAIFKTNRVLKMAKIIGIAALCTLVFPAVTGCPEPDADSMTFNDVNKEKVFTIYSDFKFSVKFSVSVVIEGVELISAGEKVSGKVKETSGKWNENFTGKAVITSPQAVAIAMEDETITISFEYPSKNTVKVRFPNSEIEDEDDPNYELFAAVAAELMAGTYGR